VGKGAVVFVLFWFSKENIMPERTVSNEVVFMDRVDFSYTPGTPVLQELSLRVQAGDFWAVL